VHSIEHSTPLTEVATQLQRASAVIREYQNGSISLLARSRLKLPEPVSYKLFLNQERNGFLLGVVTFGLPLSKREIGKLAELLDSWISDAIFDNRVNRQALSVGLILDSQEWMKDLGNLVTFCDTLYPLITHLREKRVWNRDLVGLALHPVDRMIHA